MRNQFEMLQSNTRQRQSLATLLVYLYQIITAQTPRPYIARGAREDSGRDSRAQASHPSTLRMPIDVSHLFVDASPAPICEIQSQRCASMQRRERPALESTFSLHHREHLSSYIHISALRVRRRRFLTCESLPLWANLEGVPGSLRAHNISGLTFFLVLNSLAR